MSRDAIRLLTAVAAATIIVVAAERYSTSLLGHDEGEGEQAHRTPANVIDVPRYVDLPSGIDATRPGFLLVGNSHTYALPGLKQGEPIRSVGGDTLIENFAKLLGQGENREQVQFARLAYPNFLPFEMLVRISQLLKSGVTPRVVVMGLTWRNIARDSSTRHQIQQAFRDHQLAGYLLGELRSEPVHAAPQVVEAVQTAQRQIERTEATERMQSDADRLDEWLMRELAAKLTLVGQSSELRARVFRLLARRVQTSFETRQGLQFSYDLVENDYAFNYASLEALLRILHRHHVTIVCYFAPERSDLPPLLDPASQAEFISRFAKLARELDIRVADARGQVPNDFWGWVGDVPDRSHFTEPGHELLVRFLIEHPNCQPAWAALDQP